MANNSFKLKTWTIALVTGISVFNEDNSLDLKVILMILVPIVIFCCLDAYYLYIERKYIELFNHINDFDREQDKMKMTFEDVTLTRTYWDSFKSPSIYLFYGALISIYIFLGLCLWRSTN